MPPIVLSVATSGDPVSEPSYVPSVNPSRSPSGKHVGALQEERRAELDQVKYLKNIIASGEIKSDESAQLQELYIIKLKGGIFMLETNEKKSREKKSSHILKNRNQRV